MLKESEIVHLARLSLAGRRQDTQLFIRRLIRKTQKESPALSEQLGELLIESVSPQSPLRSNDLAVVPVDRDSRLQLARIEHPVQLDIEPIWNDLIRTEIQQIIKERELEKELLKAGLNPTRSMLLTGPPGVGKSLTAKWIAHKLQRPLVVLDLSAVMSSFLGRTGNNLRHVLDYAKSTPCVLLLDEFDAIAKRRDDNTEVGELKRLVTVILQEVDDWPPTGLLIAATNHPDLLDPAVWRRFESVISFPMPSESQVEQAINQLFSYVDVSEPHLVSVLSHVFHDCSFSEIERVVRQIKRESVVHQKPIEDCLYNHVRGKLSHLPLKIRKKMALELSQKGISQRSVQQLTGVSRDTTRKLINQEGAAYGKTA